MNVSRKIARALRAAGGAVRGYADGGAPVANPFEDYYADPANFLRSPAADPRLYKPDMPSLGTEVRSGNTPFGDLVAQALGNPEMGSRVTGAQQGIDDLRRSAREDMAAQAAKPQSELLSDFAWDAGPWVAGEVAGPVGGAIARTVRNFPRAATAVGTALGLLGSTSNTSTAAGDPRKEEIQRLERSLIEKQKKLDEMSRRNFPSTRAREMTTQPILDSMKEDRARIGSLQSVVGAEDAQKVQEALAAKKDIEDKAPQSFSAEFPNAAKAVSALPFLLGTVTGAGKVLREAGGQRTAADAWRSYVDKALNARGGASQDRYTTAAIEAAKGFPQVPWYLKPLTPLKKTGLMAGAAAEGAIVPNFMEGYNYLNLPDENQQRRALQTYVQKLPEDHPEVARAKALLADETVLPLRTPDKEAAARYFRNWQTEMLPRSGAAAGEAIGGAMLGANLGALRSPPEGSLPRALTSALQSEKAARDVSRAQEVAKPIQLEAPATALSANTQQLGPIGVPAPTPGAGSPSTTSLPSTRTPAKNPSSTLSSEIPDLPEHLSHDPAGIGSKIRHRKSGRWSAAPDSTKTPSRGKEPSGNAAEDDDPAVKYFSDNTKLTKGMATGGTVIPWYMKASGGPVVSGPLHSDVAGRTDHLPINVKSGSYVIPADVVSGLGEGNTMAGTKTLQSILSKGPYGLPMPKSKGKPASIQSFKSMSSKFADGGPVPILAAGGEYVISPEEVAHIGGGDIDRGHKALDQFVVSERAKTVKTLKNLPGPKR